MSHRVWDWLAHGLPANEQLPIGVSLEEYKLAHRGLRQLEAKDVALLVWKVAAHSISEPGRLADD